MKTYLSNLEITIPQLIDAINDTKAKSFWQCTLEDILPDVTKTDGIGLYLFYDGNTLEYLGKSGGRNVLERLGGHIDHRENGIMNYYLRMMAVKTNEKKWENHKSWAATFPSIALRRAALNEIRDNLKLKSLKIIYVSNQFQPNCLDSLESVLSAFLKPEFQKCKDINEEWKTNTIATLHETWRLKKETQKQNKLANKKMVAN